MRWAEFEEEAPELAALGRERIEEFGFVFIATVRKDGGPRVNPAEAHIVEGNLVHALVPWTLKALDLRRDPRAFLHTPVRDAARGDPGEFKARARAVEIGDPRFRQTVADAVEAKSGWRPTDDWYLVTMEIESAVFHRYDAKEEVHHVLRWTPRRGVEVSTRTYL
jgi:hypothetical protein